jgi:hypothetical protein
MDLSELHVHRVTMVAPMALAGGEQRGRLFRTFRVNAPLFGPRHDHRGMKRLDLFACLGCHVGFASQRIVAADYAKSDLVCEQTGNRPEGSGTGNDSAC